MIANSEGVNRAIASFSGNRWLQLVLTAVVALGQSASNAQVGADLKGLHGMAVESLSELPGVGVLIQQFSEEDQKLGLRAYALQPYVELPLRRSGIKVLDLDKALKTLEPTLYLVVLPICSDQGNVCALTIECQLLQLVQVRAADIYTFVPTWTTSMSLLVSRGMLDKGVKKAIDQEMTQFLNDYLTANPK